MSDSVFFPFYSKIEANIFEEKEKFKKLLKNFLQNPQEEIGIRKGFEQIYNFINYQNPDFFEEVFLNTTTTILTHIESRPDYGLPFSDFNTLLNCFLNLIEKESFNKIEHKLQYYSTEKTFKLLNVLIKNDQTIMAQSITNTFIHPEKRILKNLSLPLVEWCLENNKIASLNFLLNNFEGFNTEEVIYIFFKSSKMNDEYMKILFPINEYHPSLEGLFNFYLQRDDILSTNKINCISYFSKNKEKVDKVFINFIFKELINKKINTNFLKDYDFFPKLTLDINLNHYIELNSYYVENCKKYLEFFMKKEEYQIKIWNSIKNLNLENSNFIKKVLIDFISEYSDFSKKIYEEIKNLIIEKKIDINEDFLTKLVKIVNLDEDFKKNIIDIDKDFYLILNNPKDNTEYIDKYIENAIKNYYFKPLNYINDKIIIDNINEKVLLILGNDKIIEFFILKASKSSSRNNLQFLSKIKIVIDFEKFNEQEIEDIIDKIKNYDSKYKEILKPKKWYDFSYEKPLQIVFSNGNFSIIKKIKDKVSIPVYSENEISEKNQISTIVAQAKEDISLFHTITEQPLDFNVEFKIRAESIFMQQIAFLNQIKKLENEIGVEEIYFLKNNLGKYLVQCTQTYSKALARNQTLVENPGLFKRQDHTLEAQKENMHQEALKQISLLEKEFNFVKENITQSINSDSFSEMRINTRFLEAKAEHINEENIIKLSRVAKIR